MNSQTKKIIFSIIIIISIGLAVTIFKIYFKPIQQLDLNQNSLNQEQNSENNSQTPSQNPQSIIIHVAGGVKNPGVYLLEKNARILNALKAAGGTLKEANLDQINLAQKLKDGQRILIPVFKQKIVLDRPQNPSQIKQEINVKSQKINLNAADLEQLTSIKGLGPALGQRIIDHRNENGPFLNVNDLKKIKGFSQKKLEKIKKFITLE